MKRCNFSDRSGLTLIEITIALAVFMIVLGAAAQSLIGFYAAMDLQQQRTVAAQNSRSVLSRIREARDANSDNFPGAITALFPDGEMVENDEEVDGGINTAWPLSGQTVVVTYGNPNANPLEITIVSQWLDLHSHRAQFLLSTVLTDR